MKPGYKTSEFILTIIFCLGVLFAGFAKVLPPDKAVIALSMSLTAYNVSRGLAKIYNLPDPTAFFFGSSAPGLNYAPPLSPIAAAPPTSTLTAQAPSDDADATTSGTTTGAASIAGAQPAPADT